MNVSGKHSFSLTYTLSHFLSIRYTLNTDVLHELIHLILMKMIQRGYHCWQMTNAETEDTKVKYLGCVMIISVLLWPVSVVWECTTSQLGHFG